MTLSVILGQKGREVATTLPSRSLRDAAATMSELGIGALLVLSPDQQLLGIISERDIVRAIARNAHGVLDDPVSSHMTSRVVTATPDTSVTEAMGSMTDGRFRHIPVMSGDRLVGVVSIGDLVKHRLSEMETENRAMIDYISAS